MLLPNERRETQHRAKTGPVQRVARQVAPCGVARLGKGSPLPASRALPGATWRCNAARDETGTDPRIHRRARSLNYEPPWQRKPADSRAGPLPGEAQKNNVRSTRDLQTCQPTTNVSAPLFWAR